MFSTQNQIIYQVNIFFSVTLHGLPLFVSLLTVSVSLNFFSSLLILLFVRYLFVNLFVNSVALYPFTDTNF